MFTDPRGRRVAPVIAREKVLLTMAATRRPPHPVTALITDLGPLAQLRAGRLSRRFMQLFVGLLLFGFSIALMVRAALGLAPWDVLHMALTRFLPLTIGQVNVLSSFVVLLLWIPLREKPGIGTIANAIVIGLSMDVALGLLPPVESLPARAALLASGIVLNGLATALYVGSQFGRGPRDGLFTSISRRSGWSIQLVRTGMEVVVVVLGLLLGGTIGVGTVLFALALGPLTQLMLPWVAVRLPAPVPSGGAPG